MKNREEYVASIYAKRDAKIKERKKRIAVFTSVLCIVICFAAMFAFVPKQSINRYSETEINKNNRNNNTSEKPLNENQTEIGLLTFYETYPVKRTNSHIDIKDGEGIPKNENEPEKTKSEIYYIGSVDAQKTEIAAEETMRNFGYIGEPFDPDKLVSGETAIVPADPPDDFSEPASDSSEINDSIKATKASTTAAKLRTSEEAVEEAKKIVPEEDVSKIIDDKTQVTITRTASGKSTYTVFLYTNLKLYTIELDAVTLSLIECKTKNLMSGDTDYYSPAHFPETTAALLEYKPQ